MDSLITAAARALAAGDPLGALKRVALRNDPPGPGLRGTARAQLGNAHWPISSHVPAPGLPPGFPTLNSAPAVPKCAAPKLAGFDSLDKASRIQSSHGSHP
jgi:hypothetical protein